MPRAHDAASHPAQRLSGSAAAGEADGYSDLDLILYYEQTPSLEACEAVREELDGTRHVVIWPHGDVGYGEQYEVDGVPVQLGHATFADLKADAKKVLVDFDFEGDSEPLQKVFDRLHNGLALYGAAVIEEWREKTRYTPELQLALVEKHWRFFPIWHYEEQLATRDALLWRHQVMVESAFRILAVLAALNRVYFSSFQLKRMRKLADRLALAPPRLAERLEALFGDDAIAELESLLAETQDLLEMHLPDFDAAGAWHRAGRTMAPGTRAEPWR